MQRAVRDADAQAGMSHQIGENAGLGIGLQIVR